MPTHVGCWNRYNLNLVPLSKVGNHSSVWKLCLQKQHVLRTQSPVGAERRTGDSHGNMTSSLPGYSGSVTR